MSTTQQNPAESEVAAPAPAETGTMSAGTPAIETSELTKNYGRTIAVDHLSLRVERAEIFGFLGPNGAGKTTTMRMLLGLVRPTSGTARILGMDISTQLPEILSRTGSIIENPTFYPFASGRDNLRMVARLSGVPESRIPAILDLVDLSSAAGKKYKAYSMGMKQRLAVGAALLNTPDVLILDEPANGLDPAGIVEMRELMKRLKAEGHTVLISSHVLHEIEQICDRILILNRGRVVVQGPVEALLGSRDILEVRIERAEEAEAMLASVSWIGGVTRDGDRLLVTAPLARAADLTRVLAEHGLYISGLRPQEPVLAEHGLYISGLRPQEQSLEQYFLDVTAGDAA